MERTHWSLDEMIPCWDQDLSSDTPTLSNMVDSAAKQRLLPLVFSFFKGKHVTNASKFRRGDPLLGSGPLL